MIDERPVTVSFRVVQSAPKPRGAASWVAEVDGQRVGEWWGSEPVRKGFLFGTLMDGVTHHRQWRSAVRAEFQRRERTRYRLLPHVGEGWTSKPSHKGLGMEIWHDFHVMGGIDSSHMVGMVTGPTFEERLVQMEVMKYEHQRTCSEYTRYGDVK